MHVPLKPYLVEPSTLEARILAHAENVIKTLNKCWRVFIWHFQHGPKFKSLKYLVHLNMVHGLVFLKYYIKKICEPNVRLLACLILIHLLSVSQWTSFSPQTDKRKNICIKLTSSYSLKILRMEERNLWKYFKILNYFTKIMWGKMAKIKHIFDTKFINSPCSRQETNLLCRILQWKKI